MRVAIISDIHGNLAALQAVLPDIQAENPDQIVCLGDVAAFGPHPRETIERLRALNCTVVMGNTDEWITDPGQPENPADEEARRLEEVGFWCHQQLTPAELDYLRTLCPTVELPLGDGATLLCFHGSPLSCRDVILSTTPEEDLERMLSGSSAEVMAGGHTHVQMLRRYREAILLNPGSVGLPVERTPAGKRRPPWTEYALVGWRKGHLSAELRRVPLDVSEMVRTAHESGMPHAEWWAEDWG